MVIDHTQLSASLCLSPLLGHDHRRPQSPCKRYFRHRGLLQVQASAQHSLYGDRFACQRGFVNTQIHCSTGAHRLNVITSFLQEIITSLNELRCRKVTRLPSRSITTFRCRHAFLNAASAFWHAILERPPDGIQQHDCQGLHRRQYIPLELLKGLMIKRSITLTSCSEQVGGRYGEVFPPVGCKTISTSALLQPSKDHSREVFSNRGCSVFSRSENAGYEQGPQILKKAFAW